MKINRIFNHKLITGEASVEYLSKRHTASAIHSLLPDVKLIILFRNPVRRALSDFLMMKDSGSEPDDFDAVIRQTVSWLSDKSLQRLVKVATSVDDTPLRYITKGCYVRTIAPWFDTFPRENIKIIKSEAFFLEPQEVLNETFDFLGIDRFTIQNVPHYRKARLSVSVKKETIQCLDDFFLPFNEELQKTLGEEFSWVDDTADLLDSCD